MGSEKEIQTQMALWLEYKSVERQAQQKRIAAERELEKLIPVPQQGSRTVHYGKFRCTVKQPINYKLDTEKWLQIADRIPAEFRPVKEKLVLNEPFFRGMKQHEPDLYVECAKAITSKPGKLSWSIELSDADGED